MYARKDTDHLKLIDFGLSSSDNLLMLDEFFPQTVYCGALLGKKGYARKTVWGLCWCPFFLEFERESEQVGYPAEAKSGSPIPRWRPVVVPWATSRRRCNEKRSYCFASPNVPSV